MFGQSSSKLVFALGTAVLASVLMVMILAPSYSPVEAMPCKTRIIYKTIHVPVIKKVPVIKEVKVPVYIKAKHHHKVEHHHGHHHHEGMGHKMGHMGGGGGGGGGGDFGEF